MIMSIEEILEKGKLALNIPDKGEFDSAIIDLMTMVYNSEYSKTGECGDDDMSMVSASLILKVYTLIHLEWGELKETNKITDSWRLSIISKINILCDIYKYQQELSIYEQISLRIFDKMCSKMRDLMNFRKSVMGFALGIKPDDIDSEVNESRYNPLDDFIYMHKRYPQIQSSMRDLITKKE